MNDLISREKAIRLIRRELEFLGSRETAAAVSILERMPPAAPDADDRRIASVMIQGKLPSLNEYVKACRTNKYAGARMKDSMEQLIMWQLGLLPHITRPVFLRFTWFEKNHKRDKDNVAFGKKFVLDAFQKSGKLPNDNNHFIAGFTDRFVYGKDYGVHVDIQEADADESELGDGQQI